MKDLRDSERAVQRPFLIEITDSTLKERRRSERIRAQQIERAGRRRRQASGDSQQGRFTGTVGTNECDDASLGNGEGAVRQGPRSTVPSPQALRLERGPEYRSRVRVNVCVETSRYECANLFVARALSAHLINH